MGASVRPDPIAAAWHAAPTGAPPQPAQGTTPDPITAAWHAAPATPAPIEAHYGYDGGRSAGENLRDGAREVLGQGVGLGWGDEIEAGPRALLSGQSYRAALDQIRRQTHEYEQAHGTLAGLERLAGMLGPGVVSAARGAAAELSPLQKVGKSMATGAVYGGVTGAGESEGGVGDRIGAALQGAVTGAGFGAGLSVLGQGIAGAARSYQLGPKALRAIAALSPSTTVRDALQRTAQTSIDRSADRAYVARLGQDHVTPAAARADAAAVHPDLPIAGADLGGENVRQLTGALKRLPGPQKAAITAALQTRAENAPTFMQGSLERNAPEASAALGLQGAGLDTRTANPNDVAAAARAALSARFAPRYQALLGQPTQYNPQALADVGRLLDRPSMTQHGLPFAERIAGEADQQLGTLPTGQRTAPAPSGLLGPTGAPLTTTVPTGQAPAPTAQQLHYAKIGLDRHILDVEDKIAKADAMGDPARGLRTDLRGLHDTRQQLVTAIDGLAPGYRGLSTDYAQGIRPIDAFRQGQQTSPLSPPWQVQSAVQALAAQPDAQTALAGGYGRRLTDEVQRAANTNQNPARVVVGTGADAASKTQNLRTLFGANAEPVLRDADAIDRMHQTLQKVLGNSATAERQGEDAGLGRLLKVAHAVAHSRPVAAVDALLGGEYGPQSKALADRLMLGAEPGQRTALLDWLGGLDQASQGRLRGLLDRTAPRAVGILGGYGGGAMASGR